MAAVAEVKRSTLTFKEAAKRYSEQGHFVLEDCIPATLLEEARESMRQGLGRILGRPCESLPEGIRAAISPYRQFDVQHFIHQELQACGIKRRILLHAEVLEHFIHLIGPDLAYNRAGSVVFNIHGVTDGLYQKKWHQEMWSGACLNELRIWLPLSMSPNTGGMEFVPGSHLWGMIPNRNREPVEWPESYEVAAPEMREGHLVLFHPLTLHRTIPNPDQDIPRVALTVAVRNIFYPWTGQGYFQSWQPFHSSGVGQVQKALGNPYLTPFRTLGGALSHVRPDDNKRDIEGILE